MRAIAVIDFILGALLLGCSAWVAMTGGWSTALSAAVIAAICFSVGIHTWRQRDDFPLKRRYSRDWQRMIQWQVVALLFGAFSFLPLAFGDGLRSLPFWAGWSATMVMMGGNRRKRQSSRRQIATNSPQVCSG